MVRTVQKALNDSPAARWSALFLVSFTMMASYFFADVISPIEEVLNKALKWDGQQFGLVTGSYSFFNIIGLLVIGGIILDRLGVRYTGGTFTLLMVIGAVVKAYAVSPYFNAGGIGYDFLDSFFQSYTPSSKLAATGFAIFGLGSEMAGVAVTRIIIKWFTGKELALAMGLQVAIARLGTGCAFLLSSRLAGELNAFKPVAFGVLLLCAGFVCFLIYCMMDVKLDRSLTTEAAPEAEEPFRFADVAKLLVHKGFLYISILCASFYSCVFPFLKFASSIMANKFHVDSTTASDIVFYLPFGTIIFTPLFGSLIDTKGKGASLMILGSVLLIISHLLFIYAPSDIVYAYIAIFVLGIAFSLVPAAMWPSVPKVCPSKLLGTGYALIFWIQNIGMFIFPYLIGYIRDISNPGVSDRIRVGDITAEYNYFYPEMMLVIVGLLTLFFAFMLKVNDKKYFYGLELPNKQ
ncbi:MAG: MFS transporter [Candidatus Azobacteroides sp.]|nr:MFS transporter [Candidatus Azobacteroides sp.]